MPITVASHPLVNHKLTLFRDKNTKSGEFRRLLKEITFYLGYEATKHLATNSLNVTTPLGKKFEGVEVTKDIAIIPILRAGLGMTEPMLELLPNAPVHYIGK